MITNEKTNEMNEKERENKPSIYAKAISIAKTRRIHKSSVSNVWCVQSQHSNNFYTVRYISETDEMECSCPAFVFAGFCKHILSIALLKEITDNQSQSREEVKQ